MAEIKQNHKCILCGVTTDTFDDAIKHVLSHATVSRSYSTPYFYVCPVCDRCFSDTGELDACIKKHLAVLKEYGYIGDNRE